MIDTSKKILRLVLTAAASFVVLFAADKYSPTNPDVLVTTAAARIGRPLTPMSYAGAARRTATAGRLCAAAGAVATGAYSGCEQITDEYGNVYTQC